MIGSYLRKSEHVATVSHDQIATAYEIGQSICDPPGADSLWYYLYGNMAQRDYRPSRQWLGNPERVCRIRRIDAAETVFVGGPFFLL